MFKKLKKLPTFLYIKMRCGAVDFASDERGLSGVVVAILLILVAVLAVALIWGGLSGWLGELWKDITDAGDEITTKGPI